MAGGVLSPLACTPDPAGPRLYVTSGFTDEVLIVDAMDGRILARRELDRRPGERDEPHGVAVAPDGRHWYATLAHGEPSLWKYESEGDRLVGRLDLPLRGAGRVAISPDGSRAIVPDYWLGGLGAVSEVAVVRTEDLTLIARLEVCPAPHHAAWSPQGDQIAVACSLSDELILLDGDDYTETLRVPVGGADAPPPPPGNPVARPLNVGWAPDGGTIYASLMRGGGVIALTATGQVLWFARTGEQPAQLAVTADGARVVVADRAGTLAVIDVASREVRALPLPDVQHPHGVALSPDGSIAYVAYEGSTTSEGGVVAVEVTTGTVLWNTVGGAFTLGIAYGAPTR